jgi:hypothetical protein
MAVPDKKTPTTAVRVEKGDTLSAIAQANNLTLTEIIVIIKIINLWLINLNFKSCYCGEC